MGSITKRNIAAETDEDPTRKRRQVAGELELVGDDELPSDVVNDILSRLPVKTLIRFKSLCNEWAAIITNNPHFVSMHLKNYTNFSLLCTYSASFGPQSISLCPEAEAEPGQRRLINLGQQMAKDVICGGGGNGLFLLGNPCRRYPDYRLWSPATREIKLLPNPPLAPPVSYPLESISPVYSRHSCDYCGVGEDLVANDIKVVLIRNYVCHDDIGNYIPSSAFHSSVFVYTLRSNCWTEIAGGYPYQEGRNYSGYHTLNRHAYSEGIFYRVFDNYSRYVVAFDMGSHVFHKIDYPSGGSWYNCTLRGRTMVVRENGVGVDIQFLGLSLGGQW
ncbi:unnamed protein product [Linum tenue]|uniref:F-box domain-containing protein n=1 Tax=Linum tenue TaxID=586396 RepID=A0AAV0HYF4_9ROSI|nr:unnamed protein product [Linum tenue]